MKKYFVFKDFELEASNSSAHFQVWLQNGDCLALEPPQVPRDSQGPDFSLSWSLDVKHSPVGSSEQDPSQGPRSLLCQYLASLLRPRPVFPNPCLSSFLSSLVLSLLIFLPTSLVEDPGTWVLGQMAISPRPWRSSSESSCSNSSHIPQMLALGPWMVLYWTQAH